MLRPIVILSCVLTLLSCEKEANVKLPETKPLPVIYSYICPGDSLIRLKLLSSSPLYSSNNVDVLEPVPDGKVEISGAQGTAQLTYNLMSGYYELATAAYPVVPGQTYKMTVTTSQGEVATAETEVPATTVPINKVEVVTIAERYGSSDRVKVSFTDEPGRTNYYRTAALRAVSYAFGDTLASDANINELYSDAGNDGGNVSLDGRYYQNGDTSISFSAEYYDVFLYNCSRSYYSYHRSIKNYSGDNPFSEPTLIYTNVKGGFGCFGAYTRSNAVRFIKK